MRHRAVISAALFGALVGSGAVPLSRTACEEAIRAAGKGVVASLEAFSEAFDCAVAGDATIARAADKPAPGAPLPDETVVRVAALPPRVAEFARLGAAQVAAYQDVRYATRYVDRVARIVIAKTGAGGATTAHDVAREVARHLALWMCYDDVICVATQKSRAARFARIRREAGYGDTWTASHAQFERILASQQATGGSADTDDAMHLRATMLAAIDAPACAPAGPLAANPPVRNVVWVNRPDAVAQRH